MSFLTRSTAVLLGVALLGAGCGRDETSVLPSDSGRPVTTGGVRSSAPRSACNHPYYPLQAGYEVHYEIQSRDAAGVPKTYHYSQTVSEAETNSVSLKTQFQDLGERGSGEISSTQTVNCEDGTLRANAYFDLGSRLSNRTGNVKVETRRVTGQLLPRDLRVGSEWDGSFDVSMRPTGPDAASSPLGAEGIDLTIRTHRRAVAEETVTVPAGTYRALKIEASTDFGGGGAAAITTTEWWAENAGLVKSVYPAGGAMGDIVTVAQRVRLP